MDFDALVNLKRIIVSGNVTDTDIMLLKSAINNGNVDINVSISKNLDKIFEENIDNSEFMTYLEEFINCADFYLNTPIYKLFLSNISFYPLFITSLNKKVLKNEAFKEIIVFLFNVLNGSLKNNYLELALMIKDIILATGKVFDIGFDDRDVFLDFICKNIDVFSNDDIGLESIVNREIIIKLFSYGYINFSHLYDYANSESLIKIFVYSIFDLGEYSYLLSLINDKMVQDNICDILINIITDYVSENKVDGKIIGIILDRIRGIKNKKKSLM